MAAPLPEDERRSKRFLQMFKNCADPTWGFYVYGSYARPKGDGGAIENNDEDDAPRLQALVDKLQAHVTDYLRYKPYLAYQQEIIDALRLTPAAYLPGASLGQVCTHYCQNFVDDDDVEQCGPRYSWCIIIDDKSLQTILSGPEPIGSTPPEGLNSMDLMLNADNVLVTLLYKNYKQIVKKPALLSAQGRGGGGRTTTWEGWLRIYILDLMRACEELEHGGDIEKYERGPDNVAEF